MRIKAEFWLQGCGLALLLMLGIVWPYMAYTHTILYHSVLPINHVYWGLAIDVALMCILATAALAVIEHLFPKAGLGRFGFWWGFAGAILIWRLHVSLVWLEIVSIRLFPTRLTFVICACGGLVLWYWNRSLYIRVVEAFRLILALLGVCIFWLIPQLLYMAIHPEPHEKPGFVRPTQHAPQQHRIVWVVFDELSQDQVFDHRQADVRLPTFDRLRAKSVMFTSVMPAGNRTEIVIPSLLLGKSIVKEQSDLNGELSVKFSQRWREFPSDMSLFAYADQRGWTTGVVGWYIPYCRTFAAQLDRCEWQSSMLFTGDYSPKKSIMWNIFAPIRGYFLRATNRNYERDANATLHTSDYTQLMDWSHQLIADEDIQFVFLHLPIPHPWGMYNRHSRTLSMDGSYLDNLELADTALSKISQWIAQTKLFPVTTLVVCSDHSWRVPYWRSIANWSAEEQRASQGKFDPRPVLMVQLPAQNQPYTITQPFPAIREHDLIENLLKSTPTPSGLKAWALTGPLGLN